MKPTVGDSRTPNRPREPRRTPLLEISGRLQDPCVSRDTPGTRFTGRFYAPCVGSERVGTPQIHLEATMAMKERVLAKTSSPYGRRDR